MSDTWSVDLRHYLDEYGEMADLPGPVRGIAQFHASIVSWTSAFPDARNKQTNVFCRRQPNHARCPGQIQSGIEFEGEAIHWFCPVCFDNGETRGWKGTLWDRSPGQENEASPSQIKPARPDQFKPAAPGSGESERMMRDIQQLMNDQEFDSIDDAKSFIEGLMSKPIPRADAGGDDLSRAQDLCYDAMELESMTDVESMAREALGISPDCADAYLLLSELESSYSEPEFDLIEQAVSAGERAIGPEFFEENAGYFWSMLETRPYMRARFRLVQSLAVRGKMEEAVTNCWEMLKLNPPDNQGVRYLLCAFLLVERKDPEVLKLLDLYEDDMTTDWSYNRALVLFRTEGESDRANKALGDALEGNPHVPPFLLGWKKPADFVTDHDGYGNEEEAAGYGVAGHAHWSNTYGAVRWLRQRSPSRSSFR